jgi:two-component system response regulator FlrC
MSPLGPPKRAVQNLATAVTDEQGVLRLDELEKNAIREALRLSAGNRLEACASLGISVRTLRNKLQQYREAGDPIELAVCDAAPA